MAEMIGESGDQYERCDPCNLLTKDSVATSFCTECEENLCEICTDNHASRKATKAHKPISLEEKEKKKKLVKKTCSPCGENKIEAKKVCEEFEEYLCSACIEEHLKRKATKNHDLVELASLLGRLTETNEADRFCHICSTSGVKASEEKYCVECKERFCSRCSTIHKNSKATSTHYVLEYAKLEAVNKTNKSCEPCFHSGTTQLAVKYCKECGEYLCKECGGKHGLRKPTSSHVLCDILKESQLCNICIKINEVNLAVLFCQHCKEELCEKCIRIHKNQKATKNHALVPLNEKPTSDYSELDCEKCNLCQKVDISRPAIHFCEMCELYFCDLCKDTHSRQKTTEYHVLRDAASAKLLYTRFCGPCQTIDSEKIAKMYCLNCSDNLCEECTTMHKMLPKEHKIVNLTKGPKRVIKNCGSCKEIYRIIHAKKYCIICNEYFCHTCCMHHSRQKLTEDHELKEIDEYKMETKGNCDPCMFSDRKEVTAQTFCKDCEEFLCYSCTYRHKAERKSRKHVFLSVDEGRALTQNNFFSCSLCMYLGKFTGAFSICGECKDLCIKQHRIQSKRQKNKLLSEPSKLLSGDGAPVTERRDNYDKETKQQLQKEGHIDNEKLTDIPGKPTSSNVSADTITLVWEKSNKFEEKRDYYQVSYKESETENKWKFLPGEHERTTAIVSNLTANTEYVFRVRVVHKQAEGSYSEESDAIKTASTIVRKGNHSPLVYGVPVTQSKHSRNDQNKTRMFEVGGRRSYINEEKTIMLVGATGTGKSTLVDWLMSL